MSTSESKDVQPRKDWWDKAAVISSFTSSVVIAIIGILVTYSIQKAQIDSSSALTKAQIEAERIRSDYSQRLQNSQLTAQLLEQLTSDKANRREVAVLALREALPTNTYERVIATLAQSDSNSTVRQSALKQLSGSRQPEILQILVEISKDTKRVADERKIAQESAEMVAIRARLGSRAFVFGASADSAAVDSPELGHGVFSYFLAKGLSGSNADLNSDGIVTASELSAFLNYEVRVFDAGIPQDPIFVSTGEDNTPLKKLEVKKQKISGLIIGVSKYSDVPPLIYPESDAALIRKTLESEYQASLIMLTNEEATREKVFNAMTKLVETTEPDSILFIYFAGHGALDSKGESRWMLQKTQRSDPNNENTSISFTEVIDFMRRSRSQVKIICVDASFAFPNPANSPRPKLR